MGAQPGGADTVVDGHPGRAVLPTLRPLQQVDDMLVGGRLERIYRLPIMTEQY